MTNDDGQLEITLTVNGATRPAKVEPFLTLQACLHHRLGFREVRYGCGEGVCGACMVLVDGEPKSSCLILAVQAQGRNIVTADGLDAYLAENKNTAAVGLRAQLTARQAFQCGYCSCGVMVSAAHHIASETSVTPSSLKTALSGNMCRCTGYQQMMEATLATSQREPAPQSPVQRGDLPVKMSGAAGYPTDQKTAGPLIGKILWAQYPSARISSIDTRAAAAVPGVEAVLTHRDIPKQNSTGATSFGNDQPLLAVDRVRTMADAVALVAARDEAAAAEALKLIQVTYEPLQPITDLPGAIEPGSAKNVTAQFVQETGDVDAAFRTADVVVTGRYSNEINDHACMELEGGTAWMEDGTLMIAVPHQTAESGQRAVSKVLGISQDNVRIISQNMGGSFGKYAAFTIEGYLGLLAYHLQKPVRLVLGRDEILQRRSKRHPSYGDYRLALTRDGRFLALDATILTDAGPYVGLTPAVAAVIGAEASASYNIPSVRSRVRGILTNNLPTIPMRGYGSQQISFGVESIVEQAAHKLGMDPADLRKRNYKKTRTDGWGHPIPGKDFWLTQTMDRVRELLGPPPLCPPGWHYGRGVTTIHAKYGYPYGMVDRFVVKIGVNKDGQFRVECDISDSGTAVTNEMARLLAKGLGLTGLPEYVQSRAALDDPSGIAFGRGRRPSWLESAGYRMMEWVQMTGAKGLLVITARITNPRNLVRLQRVIARPANFFIKMAGNFKSWVFPFSRESFQPRFGSSRSLSMCAGAVLDGVERFKKAALEVGAKEFSSDVSELRLDSEGVYHSSENSRRLSWAALAQRAGGDLAVVGEIHNPVGPLLDPSTGNQTGAIDFMDGSHGCDLLVRPDTGQVRILKYVAVHDVGYAFNPEALRGQILGGITMGIGQAIFESMKIQDGKVLNAGLHDYLVATTLDLPEEVKVEILESGNGMGPYGSKGIGESGAVAAPIAIANALYNALGIQLETIPSTPEKLAAMADAGAGQRSAVAV
jgi:CO/xanthine dehydrogenase Mo-binding subunit/aerobic-type carbon monoxide dehydrogenase small subunit (CoxS/CutS family)